MADAVVDAVNADEIIAEIEGARGLFKRLQNGDKDRFNTAKEVSDRIRSTLEDIGKDLSALDPEGKKTHDEMDKILQSVTTDLQIKDVRKDFKRLKSGDITINPEYMAYYIRRDLKDVGKDLSTLDPEGKKTADKINKELEKITDNQQVRIIQNLFKRLKVGDTAGYKGAKSMADAIRKELSEFGKDLSTLDSGRHPRHRKSAEIMERELKHTLAIQQEKEQSLAKAKKLYDQFVETEKSSYYPHPKVIEEYIRRLVEVSKEPLYKLGDGEQTNRDIDNMLKKAVILEKEGYEKGVSDGSIPTPLPSPKNNSKIVTQKLTK